MLMLAHFMALGVAIMIFLWIIHIQRRNRAATDSHSYHHRELHFPIIKSKQRPVTWLAIRSLDPQTVLSELRDEAMLHVSSRVNGWVIVTGPGLPRPGEDVDNCFLFLTRISRKLGHVQYFHRDTLTAHHAWVRMDDGCVTRAYAWAGETLWIQGSPTVAEMALNLKCFNYGEETGMGWRLGEIAVSNIERLPRLAARWSIDPGILLSADGLAGESSRFY